MEPNREMKTSKPTKTSKRTKTYTNIQKFKINSYNKNTNLKTTQTSKTLKTLIKKKTLKRLGDWQGDWHDGIK